MDFTQFTNMSGWQILACGITAFLILVGFHFLFNGLPEYPLIHIGDNIYNDSEEEEE